MVTTVLRHNTKWLAPSPLWQRELADAQQRRDFNRPAILRFKNDTFMDEMLALMSYYPDRLNEWEAVPETWREPMREPVTAKKLAVPEPVSFFSTKQKRDIARHNKNAEQSVQTQSTSEGLLKLYQPSQQRFYLVTASLVCRKAGLPDRAISPNKLERPSFVVRRIVPNDNATAEQLANGEIAVTQGRIQNCTEYAHVAVDSGYQWRDVGNLHFDQLAPAEERLPMFTVGFSDLNGYHRKILSGLIPVGRREAYLNAKPFVEVAGDAAEQEQLNAEKREAIKTLFIQQIAAPWKSLHTQTNNDRANLAVVANSAGRAVSAIEDDMGSPPPTGDSRSILLSREQVQTASWYILIDLAAFLEKYLRNLWQLIKNNNFSAAALATLTSEERAVYDVLNSVVIGNDITTGPMQNRRFLRAELEAMIYTNSAEYSLLSALHRVISDLAIAENLEAVEELYSSEKSYAAGDPHSLWPRFHFPLADISYPTQISLIVTLPPGTNTSGLAAYEIEHLKIDQLAELIAAAIPLDESTVIPEVQTRPKSSSLNARDAWFVIRCVYETPNCGPFHPTLLSDPTRPFEMASFFDPDAPGRPIRIPMPLDISPAGLRKYSRNATFMISDALCGKIKGIRKITLGDLVLSVLPWPFHKDLPDISKTGPCKDGGGSFGMFCSLSIPIVTLCALILLIIMVTLLDFIFRWLPLLFVCFPLPGLKGKKS